MPNEKENLKIERRLISSTLTSPSYGSFIPPQFENFGDVLKCSVQEMDGLEFAGDAIVFALLSSVIQQRHPNLPPGCRGSIAQLLTENATFCELWKSEDFNIGYPADNKEMADLLESLIGLHYKLHGYGPTLLWINDNFGVLVDTLVNFKMPPRPPKHKKRKRGDAQDSEEASPKKKNRKLHSSRPHPSPSTVDSDPSLSTITNFPTE